MTLLAHRRGVIGRPGAFDPFAMRNALTVGAYKPVADGSIGATAGWLADRPESSMAVVNSNTYLDVASTVIENKVLNGLATGQAANCIIRNCIIRGPLTQPGMVTGSSLVRGDQTAISNLLIQDCTIEMQAAQCEWDGFTGHDVTLQRCHIRWTTDGVGIFNTSNHTAAANVSVLGCVIEKLAKFYPDLSHTDGTHNDCIQIQQGAGNIIIRGNVLDARLSTTKGNTVPAGTNVEDGGVQYSPTNFQSNSVLQVNNNLSSGVTSGITFDKNWCYGGNIAINITDTKIAAGTNIGTFTDNKFDHSQYLDVSQQGTNNTQTIRINANLTATITGNVYEDNLVSVNVRRP